MTGTSAAAIGDVVADLDAWLGAWEGPDDYRLTVQRVRDEIVALRKGVASGGWVWEQLEMTHKAARAEERERCAREMRNHLEAATDAFALAATEHPHITLDGKLDAALKAVAEIIAKSEERTSHE